MSAPDFGPGHVVPEQVPLTASPREDVIALSHDLLDHGLVVRTWGNVSARVRGNAFVITPSGRSYSTMQPEDLSEVDDDGQASGPFKPSSEYPMHALCYRLRADAAMVIHTHQPYASSLSVSPESFELSDEHARLLGQDILPIASYGLPGTHTLHHGVEQVLFDHPDVNVVLMRAHGALVCGTSKSDALARATRLEQVCREIYEGLVPQSLTEAELAPDADGVVMSRRTCTPPDSAGQIEYFTRDLEGQFVPCSPSTLTVRLHEQCYAKREDVTAIRVCTDSQVSTFFGRTLTPHLDDFAQIVGLRADNRLGSNVVLLSRAALCLGIDEGDAAAIEYVLEKNARAARIAEITGEAGLSTFDSLLMNVVYRLKYSKRASLPSTAHRSHTQ